VPLTEADASCWQSNERQGKDYGGLSGLGPSSGGLEQTGETVRTTQMGLRSRWRRFESCRGRFARVTVVHSPMRILARSAARASEMPTTASPVTAANPSNNGRICHPDVMRERSAPNK